MDYLSKTHKGKGHGPHKKSLHHKAQAYVRSMFLKGKENEMFDGQMIPPRWIASDQKKAFKQYMQSIVGLYFTTRRRKVTIKRTEDGVSIYE